MYPDLEFENDEELLKAIPAHRNNFPWLSYQRGRTTNKEVIAEIDKYIISAYRRDEYSAGLG